MSDELFTYAEELVDELRTAGVKAYTDPGSAAANLPCVLVVPVPLRTFDALRSWAAEWTCYALVRGPGDLRAARDLDRLVETFRTVVPELDTAEPSAYVLPSAPDPLPAYALRFTTTVTED